MKVDLATAAPVGDSTNPPEVVPVAPTYRVRRSSRSPICRLQSATARADRKRRRTRCSPRAVHLSPRRWDFFFNDPAATEFYTLSLHDALPIYPRRLAPVAGGRRARRARAREVRRARARDRKSTRLNSSHMSISYDVFCLKKKKKKKNKKIIQKRKKKKK